jgi:hypothetical protein
MMGLQWWPAVILGLVFGAFFGPWLLVKVTGKTGQTAGQY